MSLSFKLTTSSVGSGQAGLPSLLGLPVFDDEPARPPSPSSESLSESDSNFDLFLFLGTSLASSFNSLSLGLFGFVELMVLFLDWELLDSGVTEERGEDSDKDGRGRAAKEDDDDGFGGGLADVYLTITFSFLGFFAPGMSKKDMTMLK